MILKLTKYKLNDISKYLIIPQKVNLTNTVLLTEK